MNFRISAARRLLALSALALASAAQAAPWATTGSAGAVDDDDLAIVDLVNGEARAGASVPAGSTVNIRYNIVALDGFNGWDFTTWKLRFRDNGAGARVVFYLRQYDFATGATSTVATFDSDAHGSSGSYQTQTQCVLVNWDFGAGPYYVEAQMSKTNASGQPAVGIIALVPNSCGG